MTFEEFERLPDVVGKIELLQEELIQLPPAKRKHVEIRHRLFDSLDGLVAAVHAQGRCSELGSVYMETGYRLGTRSWLQPDVSITHQGQRSGDYYEGSPALAVEVISNEKT